MTRTTRLVEPNYINVGLRLRYTQPTTFVSLHPAELMTRTTSSQIFAAVFFVNRPYVGVQRCTPTCVARFN